MLDPIAMLAINMESQPGVYALLLGSGVSSAAGIPTGHGVLVDLIRKIAAARGEDCGPDPERWLAETVSVEPSYSALLEQLAPQRSERRSILRSYFEASPEDTEAGRKVPTQAHRTIARLVASGVVRVILTTNFDRLLEESLNDAGVRPIVISTAEAVRGAPPLPHNECTIVKLHGDYLDTRIKNTATELATYEPGMDQLLDRVLDEYGLIVCGWSAKWDAALRDAIERCPNHRYSTYWALRAPPGPEEEKLIGLRRAVTLRIDSADELFDRLETAIEGIRTRVPGHVGGELTTQAGAVRELKRSLDDPMRRIALEDLLRSEAVALSNSVASPSLGMGDPEPSIEAAAARMRAYEDLATNGIALMANGCYYAQGDQVRLFAEMLDTVASAVPRPMGHSFRLWTDLRHYPALLLSYAGGVGAVAAGREGTLVPLLRDVLVSLNSSDETVPYVVVVRPSTVMEHSHAQQLPFLRSQRLHVPISERLIDVLRPPLLELARTEARYEESFNRYEYLSALLAADLTREAALGSFFYVGRFGWIARQPGRVNIAEVVSEEIDAQGIDWPLVQAGAFGGQVDRAQAALEVVREAMRRLPWM